MSELKVYHCNEWHNEYTEFYMKSEADAVIAELRDKLRHYPMMAALIDSGNKEIRHQKYKRCLDKSEYCKVCSTYYFNVSEIEKDEDMVAEYRNISDWYDKWKERWLGLAEKFKEAK